MGKRDSELTSQIISSYRILRTVMAIAAILLLLFPSYAFLLVFPFIFLCIKGMHSSIWNGLFVAAVWATWLCLIFSPILLISPDLIYLSLYAPLVFISLKNTTKPPSSVEYAIQWIIWEIPLFIWIRLYSLLGWRALEPFFTDIDHVISIGSVPLAHDAHFLHKRGVCGVVNMCKEYGGPVDTYRSLGITQLHLPTPDLHEPSVQQMKDMIAFIANIQSTHKRTGNCCGGDMAASCGKIFIHCKGGRGRAVVAAVCYLISKGQSPEDAFELIKSKRDVAARAVLGTNLVRAFTEEFATRNMQGVYDKGRTSQTNDLARM